MDSQTTYNDLLTRLGLAQTSFNTLIGDLLSLKDAVATLNAQVLASKPTTTTTTSSNTSNTGSTTTTGTSTPGSSTSTTPTPVFTTPTTTGSTTSPTTPTPVVTTTPTTSTPATSYVAPAGRIGYPTNVAYSNQQIMAMDSMANADGNIVIDGVKIKMLNNEPCIIYNASKPLIITNSILVGAADLVRGGTNCNIKMRNVKGFHINSSTTSMVPGRFVNAYYATNLDIQNCYMEGTRGILVDKWGGGDGTNGKSIKIMYNKAVDIDGRSLDYINSNGNGNYEHSQFFQITNTHIAGIEVAYNQVINLPGTSRVEDIINIYNAGGTAASHARFHHNYLQGAYPYPINATYFSGTGITTDGDTNDPNLTASFNDIYGNIIVSVCNSGINIATGHDNSATGNTIVNSGKYADGTYNAASYCGCCVYNSANRPASVFFNNTMQGNTLGYMRTKDTIKRFDQEDPPTNVMPLNGAGNTHLPDPITLDTERQQWITWGNYLSTNKLTIGVN